MSKPNDNPLNQTERRLSDDELDNLFDDELEEDGKDEKTILSEKQNVDILDNLGEEDEGDEDDDADDDPSKKDPVNLDDIDSDEEEEEEEEESENNSPFVSVLEKLAEKNVIQLFVDDAGNPLKPLNEYDAEELEDLIEQNIESAIMNASQNAPIELFKRFPESVQKVINYTLNGGGADESKLQTLFLQLANMRKFSELNPEDENDGKQIIREYLQEEGVMDDEAITDEINRISDGDQTKTYATKYKAILDSKQDQMLKTRLAQQETIKKNEIALETQIIESGKKALVKPELFGIPIPLNIRQEVFMSLGNKVTDEKGSTIREIDNMIQSKLKGTPEDVETVMLAYAFLKDPKTLIQELTKKAKAEAHVNTLTDVKDGINKGGSQATTKSSKSKGERRLGSPAPGKTIFSR